MMNQQIATLQALIKQGENGLETRIEAIANLLDVDDDEEWTLYDPDYEK